MNKATRESQVQQAPENQLHKFQCTVQLANVDICVGQVQEQPQDDLPIERNHNIPIRTRAIFEEKKTIE